MKNDHDLLNFFLQQKVFSSHTVCSLLLTLQNMNAFLFEFHLFTPSLMYNRTDNDTMLYTRSLCWKPTLNARCLWKAQVERYNIPTNTNHVTYIVHLIILIINLYNPCFQHNSVLNHTRWQVYKFKCPILVSSIF